MSKNGTAVVPGSTDGTAAGNSVEQKYSNNSAHVISGGSGGDDNTEITEFPHELAAHVAAGAGTAYNLPSGRCTVQASSDEGVGTLTTATIAIEVSNDNINWVEMGTITVAGDGDSDGFAFDAPWAYIRSNATTFTEAVDGCTVSVTLSL